uniref:Peptidylglycine alpha-amidating monooxygenase n=1 Tax=Astyanax mexicanus TaxID=7994 RepID=A0A8B9JX40_ASTMX
WSFTRGCKTLATLPNRKAFRGYFYLYCLSFFFSVDFVPHASMDTAHHMLLYGCRNPTSTKGYWDCGREQGTCEDEAKIMYAWARNAPPTKLPKDVGFKVGGDTRITYFVLQIHYGDIKNFRDHHKDCSGLTLRMTSKPQPFIAGMYLMMSVDTVIPPGKTDIACTYLSYPMYPFAFRTHTHRLGKVVSGYRIRNGQWTLIGRQSPQLPQAFYPVSNDIEVKYGDTLAARCVFTGEGRSSKTRIGGTSNDEMCNFYMMYYMDNKHSIPYMDCMDHGSSSLFRSIPNEANVPIPVSPDHMMNMMHGSNQKDGEDGAALQQPKREQEEVLDQGTHLEELADWPEVELQLGQVSGLAVDSDDNLVIFHRGDHRWEMNSFDNKAVYQQRSLGPIQQSTILVVDPSKGNVLKASGKNMFYLPHGITTDKDNNYWVTDVALHQVFKLSKDGTEKPLLVLGEAFKPGSDKSHFCKPTDVAVDPETGNIFVSDGYCNTRILKFSPEGKYLSDWGAGTHPWTLELTLDLMWLSLFVVFFEDHEVKLEPSGSSGGILGKLRGKAAGTLNLGNFFATHKGYTRQGFDRLSTEGSDLEKDDEDATDSENEEYSAPPPPVSSSQ